MGYREIIIKISPGYSEDEMKGHISKKLHISDFSFQIKSKSLDARNKKNIHWLIRLGVSSSELREKGPSDQPELSIPFRRTKVKVLIAGSGPAGMFAALILQKAGFQTILLERGKEVRKREEGIRRFEKDGTFDSRANYSFGEGGAGTFSDGKLTSRSKHIAPVRKFILESYIKAGAPGEIAYMANPHLGSDNLRIIVKNLRDEYIRLGGAIYFETLLKDLEIRNGRVYGARTSGGSFEADEFILATGHSAYETYRMLIKRGIKFRTKNFALGSRMEHLQQVINLAQWGKAELPGMKAAEYRLTFNPVTRAAVYTFCMCPGGIIVPATAYSNTNTVNGMSLYNRDLKYANAACVAAVDPVAYLGDGVEAEKVLDWIGKMESDFYRYSDGFRAPYCSIRDFINMREPRGTVETSYPMGLIPAALWELLPEKVGAAMREGLKNFSRKIRGFDTGIIMGLESKTSAPIQVIRGEDGRCEGFRNLYIAGEGSGYAGGIISSGADGIRTALSLIHHT